MKYRLPEECCSISHRGRQIEAAADGTLDLDEVDAVALAPHGLAPLPADPPRPAAEEAPPSKRSRS